MSLLRRTRTEVAGAWRSLRYDMGKTPGEPPAGGPDVTSTGMGTFGIDLPVDPAPVPAARKPRRAMAVTAFGTLTVVGAAGAYLAVVNGLGSIMSESTAVAGTAPPRVAVTTAVGMGPSSSPVRVPAGAAAPGRTTVTTTAAAPPPVPAPTDPAPPRAAAPPAPGDTPIRPAKPTKTECHCKPPVPTPTAPSESPSPTPSPSPSVSSDPGSTDPSPSESADPGDSASPSASAHGRRHKRHH
ncbi:hypothetical protein KOI35_19115 [Actinoplanes bogorensis]|uniref:Uncharacterized protein n=1 Tax=Paractinoplanes bogorensis TaxID=1610840 RepID=A0ABS5YQ96_9ACTN|nr:hypothetical protein [Actinoplanes bogorensis]MBU2665624.1 hypothetical protein [Actinoplanes bogorensis]